MHPVLFALSSVYIEHGWKHLTFCFGIKFGTSCLPGRYSATELWPRTPLHGSVNFSVTVAKYLRWLTYKEKKFILAHSFGSSSHEWLALLFQDYAEIMYYVRSIWQSKTVHLMARMPGRVEDRARVTLYPKWPKDVLLGSHLKDSIKMIPSFYSGHFGWHSASWL